jgi:hypothetical protein
VAVVNQTLNIDAGASYSIGFYYTNIDLTGYTAQAMFKVYPVTAGSALTVTPTIDVATGYVEMNLSATQTATLTSIAYKWGLELTHATKGTIRFAEGDCIVSAEVVK